jgi:hypothetical protein
MKNMRQLAKAVRRQRNTVVMGKGDAWEFHTSYEVVGEL